MERKRYQRFEPVTVRAATRVVRMAQLGRVTGAEVPFYMRLLASLDRHSGPRARAALQRMAFRRAALGREGILGAPTGSYVRRGQPVPDVLHATRQL